MDTKGESLCIGIQKKMRSKAIKFLKKFNGKLIEIPYTKNVSFNELREKIRENISGNSRVSLLSRMIKAKKIVRIIETHSPLCGLMVENRR